MKQLYYIRHGQTVLNAQRRFAGHIETPLTAEGKAQARAAGKAAKALKIDHIVASPLSRAYDTAKIIAREIGLRKEAIEVNSLAIERHMGSLEGQSWDLDLDGFTDLETTDSLDERARLLMEHLHSLDVHSVLIVSHGGFGHAMWRVTNGHVDKPYFPERHFANAEIVQLI